jgi:predicted ATP-dependent serine protease
MLRLTQRTRIQDALAHALASRKPPEEIEPLMAQWSSLAAPVDTNDEPIDWLEVVRTRLDTSGQLKLAPKALGEMLGGGLRPGHNVVVFARPETGKTALSVTMACGFARRGHKVLYVINEDAVQDLAVRVLCCAARRSSTDVKADIEGAIQDGLKNGLGNIVLRELAPGSIREIEALVKRHDPDVLIVDQLRNLRHSKTDNYTQGLDHIAQGLRGIAKRHQIVVISTTQAGDSASGRAVLDMGDIDSSNTGIPGAADVLIGMGVNEQLQNAGQRVLTVCKNKVSGTKGYVTVSINESNSRITSNG